MERPPQKGYVFRTGKFWFIRYYEDRVVEGQIQRRLVAKKLTEARPEDFRLKKRSQIPAEVRRLQTEHMLKVNQPALSHVGGNMTLAEFAEQVWWPHLKTRLREGTVHDYWYYWTSHLAPHVKDEWLRDFRTAHAQRMFEQIARSHPNMKKTTLQRFRTAMSSLFRLAIQLDYRTERNPVHDVRLPKAPDSDETYAYSRQEVEELLRLVSSPLARTIIAVAAYAGLRISEVAGLTWEAYDGKELWVLQAVVRGKIVPPKREASKAPVPVLPLLRLYLDDWRQRCGNPASGLIFPTGRGTPWSMNNILNCFIRPAIDGCATCGKLKAKHKRADHQYQRNEEKVRWHGWHAFRRGLATNLHEMGIPDRHIQDILRHSDVSVTRKAYIKRVPAHSVAAMEKLQETLATEMIQ